MIADGVRICVSLLLVPWSLAFQAPCKLKFISVRASTTKKQGTAPDLFASRGPQFNLSSTPTTDAENTTLQEKKNAILDAISSTNYGIGATEAQKKLIDALICNLEALNPTADPAQSPSVEGTWRVRYSTAPPPSNGQLGPLRGAAIQSLDLRAGVYANEILIGSDEAKPWLSAVLIAGWKDMEDGVNWMVNFKTITLTLFGMFDLFTIKFDEGTSRMWKTTFLDGDTRIVRAGVTESEGKRMGKSSDLEDYYIFFMTREPVTRRVIGDIIKPPKISFFDVLRDPAKFMDDDD